MKMISQGQGDMSYGLINWMGIEIVVLYAAVWDYKRRIIPNRVSVILLLFGMLGAIFMPADNPAYCQLSDRLIGALLPALTLIGIYQFDKRIGGGDLKMLTSLGFSLGMYALVPILLVTTLSAFIWSRNKEQNSVPLAVFLAMSVTVYFILMKIV